MAEKINKVAAWIANNFFLAAGILFVIIYLQWFRLTPLMLNGHNDSDDALVFGFIALIIYAASVMLLKFLKRFAAGKIFFSCLSLLLLYTNFIHTTRYFPLLENNIKCNGTRYYMTWGHPFFDYQWTNYTLTRWKNIFSYETQFYGYTPGAGPFEIICDEEKGTANIIRVPYDILTYSYGENPQGYYDYTGTQLDQHLYFLAYDCNNWNGRACSAETYTLHECNLDFKSCDSVYISYTDENDDFDYLVLEADNTKKEISLYDDYDDNPDRNLIFTYGEHPRCYAEGCEILQENKP